jgi:uncharacterized LabA/DUF88 family protein
MNRTTPTPTQTVTPTAAPAASPAVAPTADNAFRPYKTDGKVAILIDGGYFLKRVNSLCRPEKRNDAEYTVRLINVLCANHAERLEQQIYRVFFYDCPPFDIGLHNPLSGRFVKFKESPQYKFKVELFERLRAMRKMALRLGRLNLDRDSSWQITPEKVKELLAKKITVDDLDPEVDLRPNFRQKQVDMKIGVDIASMVLKKQVQTIVLVAGDGDFVPASKFARREGVDFILDPMWAHINPDLYEHIDGLQTVLFKKPAPNGAPTTR